MLSRLPWVEELPGVNGGDAPHAGNDSGKHERIFAGIQGPLIFSTEWASVRFSKKRCLRASWSQAQFAGGKPDFFISAQGIAGLSGSLGFTDFLAVDHFRQGR